MTPRARQILTAVLLAIGLIPTVTGYVTIDARQIAVLALALVAAFVPAVNRPVFAFIERLRTVSPRARTITMLAVFILSAAYLTFTAFRQERPLYPKYHDNQSYAIQARIIASGHLWLPAHPHWEFFDTFHVIVEPVYASMYFPGAALMFAPGALLGLPFWVIPILIAAGCVALLYRVLGEIVDNAAGLLGAMWLLSLMWFRHLSTMLMSHSALLLLGLAMCWAYLRWRQSKRIGWCFLIGALAGWAAITRPADALCYALPIGIAILLDLRGQRLRHTLSAGATIVAGAAPFLALQLVFNVGVSGELLKSPYRVYLDRDAPQLSLGFHTHDPDLWPKSKVLQKNAYHFDFNGDLIKKHRPGRLHITWLHPTNGRLRVVLEATSPSLILLPFFLAGLLGIAGRTRWVVFAILPLYCFLYLFYAALLRHYTPVVAPATILAALLGIRHLEAVWPHQRQAVATFSLLAIFGVCVSVMPELNPSLRDDPFRYVELEDARENIPNSPQVKRPALILVKFDLELDEKGIPKANIHGEPVYNYDAAQIDDNPIIFAHDLGPQNIELIRYYAQRQPERKVYYFDRTTRYVLPRGTVVDELARLTASRGN